MADFNPHTAPPVKIPQHELFEDHPIERTCPCGVKHWEMGEDCPLCQPSNRLMLVAACVVFVAMVQA